MNTRQIDFICNDCGDVISNPDALNTLKNQAIYITGCGGFVGSWLLEAVNYLNREHNFNTSVIAASKSWSLFESQRRHLFNNKNFEFIESDVRNPIEIPAQCNWVIHLAATPDNRVHASNPLQVMRSIVNGTDNVLAAASRIDNLRNFIHFSSGLVYGNQPADIVGCFEDKFWQYKDIGVASTYVDAKRMSENICQVYRSQMRLPLAILRPFAFIGPYQLLDRPWAINNFIRDAKKNSRIHIVGDGTTVRSYMYPADMAYWTLKYLVSANSGDSLNLGSPHSYTLEETAKIVSQNFNNNILIETPMKTASLLSSRFVPNTDKAKNKYGLELNIDLKTAISKTVQWFNLAD